MLRISPVTMRKILLYGPPGRRYKNTGDIRTIRNLIIGGKRKWSRKSVERFVDGEQKKAKFHGALT